MIRSIGVRRAVSRGWIRMGAAAVAGWLAIAGLTVPAMAQPGVELFAKPPQTPAELWDAVDYLVRVGKADQAAPFVQRFVDSAPDDATLVGLRDRYGIGSFARLADFPATREAGLRAMEMVKQATGRLSRDPERLTRLVSTLLASPAERQDALLRLRDAGSYAVPPLLNAVRRPDLSPEDRSSLVEAMGQLDGRALPALVATVDSNDATVAPHAAAALGLMRDPRAVPFLVAAAHRPSSPAATKVSAQRALEAFGPPAVPQSPARTMVDEARRYLLGLYQYPGDRVEMWSWAGEAPQPTVMPSREASDLLGQRFAQWALEMQPNDPDARATLTALRLDQAMLAAPGRFPGEDPTGAFAAALEEGPVLLAQVLKQALADGTPRVAAAAIQALSKVADREALAVTDPNPLVQALDSPDRRVQFQAAKALSQLAPRQRFAGSSRVLPTLARFLSPAPVPRAVVIDGLLDRANAFAGTLKQLGYEPLVATTGPEGFRLASESTDVEFVAIEPSMPFGTWRAGDMVANLRADSRTAGLPVVWLGETARPSDRVISYLERFPRAGYLVSPMDAAAFAGPLKRTLERAGATPLSDEERKAFAAEAAELLSQIARQPGSPYADELARVSPALTAALSSGELVPTTSTALGDVPTQDAQRSLADVALDPSRPAGERRAAAAQLARSIQRFGPLVSAGQERRLIEALGRTSDAEDRVALAAIVGALRGRARPQPTLRPSAVSTSNDGQPEGGQAPATETP